MKKRYDLLVLNLVVFALTLAFGLNAFIGTGSRTPTSYVLGVLNLLVSAGFAYFFFIRGRECFGGKPIANQS